MKVDEKSFISIDKPQGIQDLKYCEVEFHQIKSLPDWDGIYLYCPVATKLY